MEKKGIAVYCASAPDIDRIYFDFARRLGQLIAEAGAGRSSMAAAEPD